MFDITNTLSFNADALTEGKEYDYVTRTSINQGIFGTTGFVNSDNINEARTWSLGLLQMDFFYRKRAWYAGQFVRKIIPKIKLTPNIIHYLTTVLNGLKPALLSVLVRDVDDVFTESIVQLPTKNGEIDFEFMDSFIAELEAERIAELEAYLKVNGLDNYELSNEEKKALDDFDKLDWGEFQYQYIFDNIKQGRRLKKDDQLPGNIPFVMSGITNNGVVNYISNPVAYFPENSITLDIFGNAFYRNYSFGAGDDTGVYWNESKSYSKEAMLFITAAMNKSIKNKFSYGKKLRSSQSLNICMKLPQKSGKPNLKFMTALISAISKLVIKDAVLYADRKIEKTKCVIESNNVKER